MQSVDHQLRGSAAPIAKSKQRSAVVGSAFVFVILRSFYQLLSQQAKVRGCFGSLKLNIN